MLMFFRTIAVVNSSLLWVGRQLAWVALALMVTVILAQVFFRYVLNNALPWPDEAARFLMLWMTALIAPAAFRTGGFVSITMLADLIGKRLALALSCILLAMSLTVLVVAIEHGKNHTFGFGGKFDSSSLRIPLNWVGGEVVKVKLRYMYGSLLVCVILMILVNTELLLRSLASLVRPGLRLPEINAFDSKVEAS